MNDQWWNCVLIATKNSRVTFHLNVLFSQPMARPISFTVKFSDVDEQQTRKVTCFSVLYKSNKSYLSDVDGNALPHDVGWRWLLVITVSNVSCYECREVIRFTFNTWMRRFPARGSKARQWEPASHSLNCSVNSTLIGSNWKPPRNLSNR